MGIPGLSLKTYSKQKGISLSTFSYWVRKFKKEKSDIVRPNGNQEFSQIAVCEDQIFPGSQAAAGEWLGNLPQIFVHVSLIGTIIDYKHARYGKEEGK